jgi:hypothetical protein
LLLDLVAAKPKDEAYAIRTFVNCTAMLRDCGFRHIGAMLARLLSADTQGGPDDAGAIAILSPSSVTEKQAIAIGSAIVSSVRQSHVPATALKHALQADAVLRAMKSGYVWFGPMLEFIIAHTHGAFRRSSRLSSIFTAKVPSVVPIGELVTLGSDGADEESSFTSVVRSAHPTSYTAFHLACCSTVVDGTARRHRCLRMLTIVKSSP